ncbi:hypothetical protein EZJ43_07800 [Pedobacter changchengzhani]|uniref:Uncharacterized protein n=1 Tax=Pedobacter changchengzhani TaxID=2529274 RepID=A0A4V3A070_9SPHI|nr:hypothetical protein [Pedobacter changchengzhani]TDG36413.1 hypothetical protein EZJ43_07800 [Pedobacter changchengzhani]
MNTPTDNSKKFTKKHLLFFVVLIAVLSAYGYYELVLKAKINGSTLIDNPTAQAIDVTIDGTNYNIPANTFIKVNLELGQHKITCEAHNIVDEDLNIDPVIYGVINPTKSKYVTYMIIYTEKDLRDKFKPYEIEGREIYSFLDPPKVSTALFIPDLTNGKGNIDDKEPSTESYSRINQDYSFLYKVFRLKDFFEFYDKNNK